MKRNDNNSLKLVITSEMKHITLKEMLDLITTDALSEGYCTREFYWKRNGEYYKIDDIDVFCGYIWVENNDYTKFEWQKKESSLYVYETRVLNDTKSKKSIA